MRETEGSIHKSLLAKLLLVVACMFAFGFLLVPIYDVFCEVTGLNGKTSSKAYQAIDVSIDNSREVEVQFIATNNDGMSWQFKPNISKIKVHPGEAVDVSFFAANPSNKRMVAQAIPSVSPGQAAAYFHKTECFCFEQQALDSKQNINMPLRFIVDPDLPKHLSVITLSYTLFDVTDKFDDSQQDEVEKILKKTTDKFTQYIPYNHDNSKQFVLN